MCVCVCVWVCVRACVHVPYSGNLSRVKTFANFTVLAQVVKVLNAKILIECEGGQYNTRVNINGCKLPHRKRSFPIILESFIRENRTV